MLTHWLKFNTVGIVGIGVQLLGLAILKSGFGVDYIVATGVAVELAVLHNFVWHERWTWSDRKRSRTREAIRRLLRFHIGNGAVSLLGNLALMWVLVDKLHLHYLPANMIAIASCSVVNFFISDQFVFTEP